MNWKRCWKCAMLSMALWNWIGVIWKFCSDSFWSIFVQKTDDYHLDDPDVTTCCVPWIESCCICTLVNHIIKQEMFCLAKSFLQGVRWRGWLYSIYSVSFWCSGHLNPLLEFSLNCLSLLSQYCCVLSASHLELLVHLRELKWCYIFTNAVVYIWHILHEISDGAALCLYHLSRKCNLCCSPSSFSSIMVTM